MDFATEIVRRVKPRRALSVAHVIPPFVSELGGEYVHVGAWSAPPPLRLDTLQYRKADTSADAVWALETMPQQDPFDLVFIDHRHDAESVVAQYNAAWRLSSDATVFLFDDAVPRSLEMARAAPGPGWWVGQVWMLRHLLDPSGRVLAVVDVGATGVMIAMGCGPIDVVRSRETIARLDRVESFAELQANLPLTAAEDALSAIVAASLANSAVPVTPVELPAQVRSREVIDEEQERAHPQPSFVADLSGYDLDTSRLTRPDDRTPGKYLETFAELHVLAGSEFYADGQCFFKHARHADRSVQQMLSGDRYVPSSAFRHDEAGQVWLQKDYLERAEALPAGLFMGTPDEIDNWGMWLLYGLPALDHYVSRATDYSGLFIAAHHGWQKTLIGYMGVDPGAVHAQDVRKPYAARDLTMMRYSFRNLSIPEHDRPTFERLRHRAMKRAEGSTPKRIFISRLSRSRAGSYRALVNEEALIEAVTALGFAVVEPERLDFEQQIQLFAGADTVVGLGGAGIFNAVFCAPGTKVVTIESTLGFIGSHANIFATMGLEYGLIVGREDRDDPAPHHKAWSVDVEGVVHHLRQFCC